MIGGSRQLPGFGKADYEKNRVLSASSAGLVVLLYDRMLLDLRRAERAQIDQDWLGAREQLLHAQEIITHLAATLRPEVWAGGPGLAALYTYLRELTVEANIHRARAKTAEALAIVEPLAEAWRSAASTETLVSGASIA